MKADFFVNKPDGKGGERLMCQSNGISRGKVMFSV